MKTKADKPKQAKDKVRDGRLNLPDMTTQQGIVLGISKVIRYRTAGRISSFMAKDIGYLAGVILKALEAKNAPDHSDATAIAGEFSKVVSGASSGTVAYDYSKLQVGKDSLQDSPRGPEELQDGMGEETPGE